MLHRRTKTLYRRDLSLRRFLFYPVFLTCCIIHSLKYLPNSKPKSKISLYCLIPNMISDPECLNPQITLFLNPNNVFPLGELILRISHGRRLALIPTVTTQLPILNSFYLWPKIVILNIYLNTSIPKYYFSNVTHKMRCKTGG